MSNPVSNNVNSGASALGGTQALGLKDLNQLGDVATRLKAGAPRPGLFTLDAKTQSAIVQTAFVQQVQAHPELLDKSPADVERMLTNVPPGAFRKAIAGLGVSTDDKTLGQILQSVPPATAKKIVTEWFKGLPQGQQAVVLGVAAGVLLKSGGLDALRNLGLKATLVKGTDGSISVALVPDAGKHHLAGQVSGQLTIPLGKGGPKLKLEGQAATDGTTLFKAGLDATLNKNSKLNLGVAVTNTGVAGNVSYSNGSFKVEFSVNEKAQVAAAAGVNVSKAVRLEAGYDPDPTKQFIGKVTLNKTF